jgi:hypothetical protein
MRHARNACGRRTLRSARIEAQQPAILITFCNHRGLSLVPTSVGGGGSAHPVATRTARSADAPGPVRSPPHCPVSVELACAGLASSWYSRSVETGAFACLS